MSEEWSTLIEMEVNQQRSLKNNKKSETSLETLDSDMEEVEIVTEVLGDIAEPENDELDATKMYLGEIGFAPLLQPEEEVNLARLVQQGDLEARNRMIVSNLRLVVKIARRYLNRGLPLLDLVEEGNLGLIRAIEKFDPERGFRFSTYGTWWIRQNIERALMSQTRTIRLPIHIVKEMNIYLRTERELAQTLDHEPTYEDIAKKLNKKVEDVESILRLNEKVTSLDMPVCLDNDKSLIDTIPDHYRRDPLQELIQQDFVELVDLWLDELTIKQRDVITRRFGLRGHEAATLEEVGREIGLTRERVRQIQVEALDYIRHQLTRHELKLESFFSQPSLF
jgi:RNA polymerase nonessential primary-like sigma factor